MTQSIDADSGQLEIPCQVVNEARCLSIRLNGISAVALVSFSALFCGAIRAAHTHLSHLLRVNAVNIMF